MIEDAVIGALEAVREAVVIAMDPLIEIARQARWRRWAGDVERCD